MKWKTIKGRGTGSLYSLPDRFRMMQMRAEGKTIEQIAKEVGCSTSTLVTITAGMKEEGYVQVRRKKVRLSQKGLKELEGGRPHPKMELVQKPNGVELKFTPPPAPPKKRKERIVSSTHFGKVVYNDVQDELEFHQTFNKILLHPGWFERMQKLAQEAS